jgi:hypothetical protein
MTRLIPRPALLAALMVVLILSASCVKSLTPTHPNQINTVDGAMYDSLIVAQASLAQATTQLQANPSLAKYRDTLNQAIAAFNAAQAAYKVYHSAGAPADQAVALQSQVADLVAQVSKLLSSMGVVLK